MTYILILLYSLLLILPIIAVWTIVWLWKHYRIQMRKIDEEVQFLHDVIYSNEGKQVLHLKYGRRKGDIL